MNIKRNLAIYGIAFLTILGLNFILPRLMQGDPLTAIYGDEALIAMTDQLKASPVAVKNTDICHSHCLTAIMEANDKSCFYNNRDKRSGIYRR